MIVVFLLFYGVNGSMKFSESLKKNRDFQKVYGYGKSYANRFFVMYEMQNGTEHTGLGIKKKKKVGNRVVRHHRTRLVREVYRLHEDTFNSGLDVVVIARVAAKHVTFYEVENSLLHLANLHKILCIDNKGQAK